MDIRPYLDDLEARLDDEVETQLWQAWKRFSLLQHDQPTFEPRRPEPTPPRIEWPTVRTNEALDDPDKMLLQQYAAASNDLAAGNEKVLMVRANFGTPIMPMLFGAELFVMPEETNTLPASHPIPGGADGIRRLLDRGMPSLDQPYLQKVFDVGRRFVEIQKQYPKIAKHVFIYHPDLQGPTDILEMIWGSDVFFGFVDEPDLVKDMLQLITDAYIRVMRHWESITPLQRPDGITGHWGWAFRGSIMLRDDSAMNLSPQQFEEFLLPYDRQLLRTFGGGAIHACGRVDHFVKFLPEMEGLYAFNMSQPHLNDLETVWRHTVDRDIVLLAASSKALIPGRDPRGRVNIAWR